VRFGCSFKLRLKKYVHSWSKNRLVYSAVEAVYYVQIDKYIVGFALMSAGAAAVKIPEEAQQTWPSVCPSWYQCSKITHRLKTSACGSTSLSTNDRTISRSCWCSCSKRRSGRSAHQTRPPDGVSVCQKNGPQGVPRQNMLNVFIDNISTSTLQALGRNPTTIHRDETGQLCCAPAWISQPYIRRPCYTLQVWSLELRPDLCRVEKSGETRRLSRCRAQITTQMCSTSLKKRGA